MDASIPPPDQPPAVGLVAPPWHRSVSARVAGLIVLLVGFGLVAALGVYDVADNARRMVSQIGEVARLRMYTKALLLETVRPGIDRPTRVARAHEIAAASETILERLDDHLRDASWTAWRHLPLSFALTQLREEWSALRERADQAIERGLVDQALYMHEAEALARAEALVDALQLQADRQRDLYLTLIAMALVLGVVLTGFAYHVIQRRLIGPALELDAAARRLSGGDLTTRVRVRSGDEIGALARAFNQSAAGLASMRERIAIQDVELRDSEQRWRSLWQASTDGIVIVDAGNVIRFANPAVEDILGYRPDQLTGRPIELLQPERLREAHRCGFARYLASGRKTIDWHAVSMQALHRDGHEIEVELSFSRFETADGPRFAAFLRDVTVRRRAEAALRLSERALEASANGVAIGAVTGEGLRIVYVNPAFERLTGERADEVRGRCVDLLPTPEVECIEATKLHTAVRHRHEAQALVRSRRKDGGVFWSEVALAPVFDAAGAATHMVSVFNDVSDRKRDEEALKFNATHDALTGLPNRLLFTDRLEQAVGVAQYGGHQLAVMYLDLDQFNVINDSLGHAVGDALVGEIARRLSALIEEPGTVARVGGDEFAILIPEIVRATPVAALGERLLEAIGRPLAFGGHEIVAGASIGVAVYPRDGADGAELLCNADIAMYRAKEEGGHRLHFFTEELQARVTRRLSVENALRRALEHGEFELHFQPQAELAGGRIVGAEALIRWRRPGHGLVAPAEFVPIAEECGLIVPIGSWVIDAACAEAARWRAAGVVDTSVAINLSARQFRDKPLLSTIEAALARHGLDALALEVELTESLVMHDPDHANAILQRMKALGLTVSLDDFGTGYSSLSHLKRFPIDVLKIDRSFVKDTPDDDNDTRIVRAIIDLAHSLKLRVIAEGVETEAQWDFLAGSGCDLVQGFRLGRPMPGDELLAVLDGSSTTPARRVSGAG